MAHCGVETIKVLLEMEGRSVLWDFIPNVGQLELACIPIKRWIIDPNVHGLLDGLPLHILWCHLW